MPDIYVPYNANDYPEYYNRLLDKGLIFRFAFSYTDSHRHELSDYADFADFDENFEIGNKLFSEFTSYARDKGIENDRNGIRDSEVRIKILMKAFIARNLYDDDGFYPVYHRIDETFLKAINYLEESK